MNMGGWQVYRVERDELTLEAHAAPLDDLREHELALQCWCRPKVETLTKGAARSHVVTHNALDQREQYEEGRPLS